MHFGIKQCLSFDIPCLGSDSSCPGSGSEFSPGGSRSESAASESDSELEPLPARKKVKPASAGNLKGKQPPEVQRSKPNRKSDDPLPDMPDRHGSGGGSSGGKNRRKSIKESKFAAKYSDLLKPVYKYYQAMQFAAHGAHFQWEANHRARCVYMLLDAAKECHKTDTYTIFKNAVEAELHGDDGIPR